MSGYQPSTRRPIADTFRRTAQGATQFCVRLGIHPDAISYMSIVAAALAAVCFWKSAAHVWLLLGRAGVLLPAALVQHARRHGGARFRQGELARRNPERSAGSRFGRPDLRRRRAQRLDESFLGYWAAIFALLTAYVGMFGQAVGVQREFSGVMSKPWRMVALHIGAWLTLALLFGRTIGPFVGESDDSRLDLPRDCRRLCSKRWLSG